MENEDVATSFMQKLLDWKEFERFVARLYDGSDAVDVQHDVTMHGRSGAKRQVDVLVSVRQPLHTLPILIECKRLKERVDRPRIDVLAAAVDDLGAARGAMFTTVGYEEGAELYARDRKIDLFVIRDLEAREWGLPGRIIRFDLNLFSHKLGKIEGMSKALAFRPDPPDAVHIDLKVEDGRVADGSADLFSTKNDALGGNLVDIAVAGSVFALNLIAPKLPRLPADRESRDLAVDLSIVLDFKSYEFRRQRRPGLLIDLDRMTVPIHARVHQWRFVRDRGADLDVAVMIENIITSHRMMAVRKAGETNLALSPQKNEGARDCADVLVNDSIMQIIRDPRVVVPSDDPVEQRLKVDPPIELAVGPLMAHEADRVQRVAAIRAAPKNG